MMEWFARRARDASKRAKDEQGFTLIELLVVVIIIGILAAIAIPVFLNQRANAWDAAAESDVRNMATAQEGFFAATSGYANAVTGDDSLEGQGFQPSESVSGHNATGDGSGYCVEAQSESDTWYSMSNTDSGPQDDEQCS